MLCNASWDRMAICAHGEGGHINLGSIVLCGLIGPVERGPDGRPTGGCYIDATGRHCKRAPEPRTRVMSVGDIRAAELHLLSCASSLMCGELYDSNVSATLSAAEGYPRAALLTDRIVSVHSVKPELLTALRGDGAGLGAVCAALNDMEEHLAGCRPYLVFGDPAGPPVPWRCSAVGAPIPRGEGGRAVALEVKGRLPEICALDGLDPAGFMECGVSRLLAWHPPGTATAPLTLVDGSAALKASEAWLMEIAGRLGSATAVEHAIARHYEARLASVPEMVEELALVRELRLAIEALLSRAIQLCQTSRSVRTLLPDLKVVRAGLAKTISFWDRHFAQLMANHLFGGPCYALATDGMAVTSSDREVICDHCGIAVRHLDMMLTYGFRLRWHRVECDLCGGKSSWPDTGRRLTVRPAATLIRGQAAALDIALDLGEARRPEGLMPGVLVVHAQDKALRVFHRCLEPADCASYALKVTPPEDIAPDLQTLHVALVEGLLFEVFRHRWPVIP
jgi:hypothetical protein